MKTRLDATASTENLQRTESDADIFRSACLGGLGLAAAIGLPALLFLDWESALPWLRAAVFAGCVPVALFGLLSVAAVLQAGAERLTRRDLNGSGDVGDIRLIPVTRREPTLDGQPPEDIRHFVASICVTGDWTQGTWRGKRLPSGRRCNNEIHARMVGIIEKAGFITGRKAGAAGALSSRDPGEILTVLGLTDLAN